MQSAFVPLTPEEINSVLMTMIASRMGIEPDEILEACAIYAKEKQRTLDLLDLEGGGYHA